MQAYARSLVEPAGPWTGFAADTVRDWLTVLGELAPAAGEAERTLLLAVLRGGLLDLLATGDIERVGRRGTPAPGHLVRSESQFLLHGVGASAELADRILDRPEQDPPAPASA